MLLLILSLLALPLNSCRAALVLTNRPKEILAAVSYGVEQARTCVRVILVLFRYSVVVIEKEGEKLSVRAVKLAALELPKFVVHYALFEKVKIDLAHIFYRIVGRPRRGRTGLSRRGRPRCGRAASPSSPPLSTASLLR